MKVSIIDWIVKKLKKCIGIVEDGDTASSAISKGQYVVWKGSLYTADGAISSGTTLSASGGSKNLTAVTDGGLNSLNSKVSITTPTVTKTANIKNNSSVVAKKFGNIVSIYMDVYAVSTSSEYVTIASLSEAPSNNVYFVMIDSNDGTKMCRLTTGGLLQIHGTVADKNYMGNITYISQS